MPLIQWSDALSIGIPSIDDQHKRLVAILNESHEAILERRGREVMGSLLARMIEYTEDHFAQEEALLEAHGYLDLDAHRALHQELKARVHALVAENEAGSAHVSLEIVEFLRDWLRDHIAGTDKKYAPLLIAHGVR